MQEVALLEERAAGRIDASPFVHRHHRGEHLQARRLRGRHRHALYRESHGRLDEPRPGEAAVRSPRAPRDLRGGREPRTTRCRRRSAPAPGRTAPATRGAGRHAVRRRARGRRRSNRGSPSFRCRRRDRCRGRRPGGRSSRSRPRTRRATQQPPHRRRFRPRPGSRHPPLRWRDGLQPLLASRESPFLVTVSPSARWLAHSTALGGCRRRRRPLPRPPRRESRRGAAATPADSDAARRRRRLRLETQPKPQVILVPINTDAVTRRTILRGSQVVLVISGAAGEEVHLHGYDVTRHIGQNGTVRLPFRATIPGRFEVELEASHRQIADLTVR